MTRATLGLAACVVALGVAGLASPVRADSGATFGESARAASLATSVTARPGDTSAIALNPAGLGDVDRSTFALIAHAGRIAWDFARAGEPRTLSERAFGGYAFSLVLRMPGPEWLRRFRLGMALHLPAAGILQVDAPSRLDVPLTPLYGSRAERTAATFALGVELPGGLRLGVGIAVTPALYAATTVRYDPSRGHTADAGVIVSIDRELRLGAALVAGLRYQPVHFFALGLAFRSQIALRAFGPNSLQAGSVLADDPIDFTDFLDPDRLTVGIAFFPLASLSISGDATWARWSAYSTIHDEAPDPRFHDVAEFHVGVEWTPLRWLAVRAGWGFEPTPVPLQVAASNFIDQDRNVLALGVGFDLGAAGLARARIDLYARTHVATSRGATKDASRLPDADPMLRGRQLDDLGYPSFTAGIQFFQAGVTLTAPLEGDPGTPHAPTDAATRSRR